MIDIEQARANCQRLHDADLYAIQVHNDKRLELSYLLADQRKASMLLTGESLEFRADAWRRGNIILDVEVRALLPSDHRSVAWVYGDCSWEQAQATTQNAHESAVLQRLIERNCVRVEITTSYGCFLIAFCEAVSTHYE